MGKKGAPRARTTRGAAGVCPDCGGSPFLSLSLRKSSAEKGWRLPDSARGRRRERENAASVWFFVREKKNKDSSLCVCRKGAARENKFARHAHARAMLVLRVKERERGVGGGGSRCRNQNWGGGKGGDEKKKGKL